MIYQVFATSAEGERNNQTLGKVCIIDRLQWVIGEGCGVPSIIPQHESFFLAPPILCSSKPLAQLLLLTDIFHLLNG